jgi:hypothetical protein
LFLSVFSKSGRRAGGLLEEIVSPSAIGRIRSLFLLTIPALQEILPSCRWNEEHRTTRPRAIISAMFSFPVFLVLNVHND